MKRFTVRLIVIATICMACSSGVNRKCVRYPDDTSDCPQGLICDTFLGTGREYLKGNNYVVDGRCRPPRKRGDRCTGRSECEVPTACVGEPFDPALPLSPSEGRPGHCK
jgi:hypothetical protein